MKLFLSCLLGASLPILLCSGCMSSSSTGSSATAQSSADPHDHAHDHDHPESLPEAIQTLASLHGKIKEAFESGDPEQAHGELHEVAHLLDEAFPGLIKKSSLSDEVKAQVKSTIDSLFDAFGKLDGVLHDGEQVEFGPIDETIRAGLEQLRSLIQ